MITIKKIILLPILFFLLSCNVTAFAENNYHFTACSLVDSKFAKWNKINRQSYKEECEGYIEYFKNLVIYKIYEKNATIVKEKTSHKVNFTRGQSRYKLVSRLKVSNFLPYGEITLTGSLSNYNLKFYPLEKKLTFQFEIKF